VPVLKKESQYAKESNVEVPVLCTAAYWPTSSTGYSSTGHKHFLVVEAGVVEAMSSKRASKSILISYIKPISLPIKGFSFSNLLHHQNALSVRMDLIDRWLLYEHVLDSN